jgi:hypothetical protein
LKDAKLILKDVFTEKERGIILSDYHRLRIENEEQSSALRIETDVILTEHPLDT